MLRISILFVLLIGMVALVAGCGGGGHAPVAAIWPAGGTLVSTDVDASTMLSWDEIKAIPAGTILYVRVNRLETEVREYQVRFCGIEESGGEHLVDCTAMGELMVGAGDSGSPVVTADGRLVACLCYGVTGDPKSFLARWASDVEKAAGEIGGTRSGLTVSGHGYKALEPVRFVSGISESAAARMGRVLPDGFQRLNASPATKSMAVKRGGFDLIGGQSICANEISGDLVTGGVIGSYSFSSKGKHFIFGHSYNQDGETAMPITLARMVMMLNSTIYGPMKEAEPFGPVIGTASADYGYGVVVDDLEEKTPATFSVDVNVSVNGGESRTFHHDVTSHHGSDVERYFTTTAIFMPIDHVIDKITGGSASGTLEITLSNGSVKHESFSLPDPELTNQTSSDITQEVTDRVTQLLDEDISPGISPVAISLIVSVTDELLPQISIRLWDSKGHQLSPSDGITGTRQFYLDINTYKLQAWVAGWKNVTVSWNVSDDSYGIVAKTDKGIDGLAEGQAELTVTVTNNDTSETQYESFTLQVYDY